MRMSDWSSDVCSSDLILGEDPARALSIFDQLTGMAPDHPAVVSGRLRALIALDRDDEAEAAIAALPEEIAGLPEIERAKSALALNQDAAPVGALSGLQAERIGRAAGRDRVSQYG